MFWRMLCVNVNAVMVTDRLFPYCWGIIYNFLQHNIFSFYKYDFFRMDSQKSINTLKAFDT